MSRHSWCRTALVALALLAPSLAAEAQYFGRNKVQYETFDWRVIRSDHFDNYFYPAESLKVHDAARQAERWYLRLSETFRHAFDRKSLIFYADHPDFQQTNVIGSELSEGTGGVTEGLRTRVIMPFTGMNWDDHHVLGHELVHVFQYNIAEGTPGGGLQRMGVLPLWMVEGMAEYFSIGRDDPHTAMWMRDAVLRDRFPTIKQLTTDPRFFPYRYGHSLWAYVGGRWGDRSVIELYRAALRVGIEQAFTRTIARSADSLSADWAAATKATYQPQIAGRTHPDSVGTPVIRLRRSGDYNLAPTLSPDGRHVAFFGSRSLFSIDLFIADAHTGRVIRKLAGPESDRHVDAISFLNSSGDWSPDGKQFAFIVFAQGDNEIAITDVGSADVERRINVPGVGAISSVSWSPDGRTLVFSGIAGGISDLYTLDVATGEVRRLTTDRHSELQPTWSPDGRSIAFITDRVPATNFERMEFGGLALATMDVGTGAITVRAPFPRGKHINPQFSPDGRDLFFISDQDGVSDVYRLTLATGEVRRITRVATGISGITAYSPALTVARTTGRLMFTVFKDQGHAIHAMEYAQAAGEVVDPAATATVASAGALPPTGVERSTVMTYLTDATGGLPTGADFTVHPYRSRFDLDAVSQPSVGVQVGNQFGSSYGGGIAAFFGDQLGDRQITAVFNASGTIRDIGGGVFYANLRNRLNWGAGLQHMPYTQGALYYRDATAECGTECIADGLLIQRIFVDQAMAMTRYPFSSTRRAELNFTVTRLAVEIERFEQFFTPGGAYVGEQRVRESGGRPITYVQPAAALVGDNSFFGFVSPVQGQRYRLEVAPNIGSLTFQTALADWRRYLFVQPVTLGARLMHYGRYGRDAERDELYPVFLGEETLIRGYGYGSFRVEECSDPGAPLSQACPVMDRLFGSRIIVANAELRIPVFGTRDFGLLNVPFLPLEISPFFDAGIAYTSDQPAEFRWTRQAGAGTSCTSPSSYYGCAERIPVFSTGLSARLNVLGYFVFEAYLAHPFQRPTRDWVWGFQIAPGW